MCVLLIAQLLRGIRKVWPVSQVNPPSWVNVVIVTADCPKSVHSLCVIKLPGIWWRFSVVTLLCMNFL